MRVCVCVCVCQTPAVVESKHVGLIRTAQLVVADGNLSPPTFTKIVTLAKSYSVPVFFEPTSDHKCLLPVTTGVLGFVDVMKPNLSELCAIVSACLDLDLIMQVRPIDTLTRPLCSPYLAPI